ncbi:hypothetical protein BD626DRAFT_522912 [Schizophyllum amplum]|uniref:Uncharacterized protein n=1 Tax=Schizophyllum amplum TaxID=97359 RepID=A0A550BT46_9AGAR|nr:hypothetical protein BD626DRAFT_522912 [Auriculariopsis ampla]
MPSDATNMPSIFFDIPSTRRQHSFGRFDAFPSTLPRCPQSRRPSAFPRDLQPALGAPQRTFNTPLALPSTPPR